MSWNNPTELTEKEQVTERLMDLTRKSPRDGLMTLCMASLESAARKHEQIGQDFFFDLAVACFSAYRYICEAQLAEFMRDTFKDGPAESYTKDELVDALEYIRVRCGLESVKHAESAKRLVALVPKDTSAAK